MDPTGDLIFVPYAQMLEALLQQLDKADAHAEAKGFAFEILLQARLAPDMHPLASQLRFTCMQATDAWSRVTGSEIPDTPEVNSLEAARALIVENVARLRSATRGIPGETAVELRLSDGAIFDLSLDEFIRSWALPQFYFHLNIAYAILRHNGVAIGKADYVPHIFQFARAS
ncbi:MAG: DUF1993 family protein [Nannocystales bacterium]